MAAGCGQAEPKGTCVLDVVDKNTPVRGPADAWVTMVEFSDFQCPYCRRASDTLDELATAYPDDLRLIFRHFPLPQHASALNAAIAAQCVQTQDPQPSGRFWDMAAFLFANQNALSDSDLAAYAAQLALDMDAWNQCFTSRATLAGIQADQQAGNDALVTGTPTFFVNGKRLVGALPIADFRAAIDDAIAQATASGISRSGYYTQLLNEGCKVEQP